MNLYNPNANLLSKNEANTSENDKSTKERNRVNQKIRDVLLIIPDYGFLLDTKLALP